MVLSISELRGLLSKLYLPGSVLTGDCLSSVKKEKIINSFSMAPRYFDEPFLFRYSAKINFKTALRNLSSEYASGTSFIRDRAVSKCLGEAIERHCLGKIKGKKIIKDSLIKLKSRALDFTKIVSFSESQMTDKNLTRWIAIPTSEINWTYGTNLINQKKILIPAQMVFVPYNLSGEKIVQLPISTGAAAHRNLKRAITNGLLEVIERDAFMIHYLSNTCGIRIGFKDNNLLHKIGLYLKKYRLQMNLFLMPTEIKTSNIMAIVIDMTGNGPLISAGMKSDFDPQLACIGAIEEAIQSRPWIRTEFAKSPQVIKKGDIESIVSRGLYWYEKSMLKYLRSWLENKKQVAFNDIFNYKKIAKRKGRSEYEYVLSELKQNGHVPYFIDLTVDSIKKMGFRVVKCIVPTLHPLYLDEGFPYFGGKRIYELPFKLGLGRKILRENDLNKQPHFFL